MSPNDLKRLIKETKKLGLRSVKFLGAGEPFQNKNFLGFLRFLKWQNVVPLVFTKGHVIGDDAEVARWNSHHGITTGEQLACELKKLNVSILLGFNSFNSRVHDQMVGSVKNYTEKRNRALEILARAGFNRSNPTRLALIATPITKGNVKEIFAMYRWARVRNIHFITCPTMVSGRCATAQSWQALTPSATKLVGLYTKIYQFNLQTGLQRFAQLQKEGIASYAGAHPCNQVACGMYVTLTGTVLRCPGDDTTVLGSIWQDSLKTIWERSENYGRAGQFNCGCPPKYGKPLPYNLFTDVMKNLQKNR